MTRLDVLDWLHKYEKVPHKDHQVEGVFQLVEDTDPSRGRVVPKVLFLGDQVGAGKTKQVIDASQILYLQSRIDTNVVIAPGYARTTWADEDPALGQVALHAWDNVANILHEFNGGYIELDFSAPGLHWVVTNFEFIRYDRRRDQLLRQLKGRKCWMIYDEAWNLCRNSAQMRACRMIRNKRGDRVTLLNGTPMTEGNPEDLYYPFEILDSAIIGVENKAHFKSKYFIMDGAYEPGQRQHVVGYQNLDDLNRRVAPYILARKTRDCFDLPPMLDPIVVEVKLSDATWKIYQSMKNNLVANFGKEVSVSKQAITKVMRLSQITSGFLGGLEDEATLAAAPATAPLPDWLKKLGAQQNLPLSDVAPSVTGPVTREIGREKLDGFLKWFGELNVKPHKLLTWCCFKPELERLTEELKKLYPVVLNLKGGQSKEDRDAAKLFLAPNGDPREGAVAGNQKAGGASLNFAASPLAVYFSNTPRLIERTQSIGRIERPGAKFPMLIVDIVATGPKGQKTWDHVQLSRLRKKEDMAKLTVNEWRKIIEEL